MRGIIAVIKIGRQLERFILTCRNRFTQWLFSLTMLHHPSLYFGRRKAIPITQPGTHRYLNAPKPDWVPKELIRMKALMPDTGCRPLAQTFNRRFSNTRQMTVGKTYVAKILSRHQYEIQVLRTNLKKRPPRPIPLQRVWGVDLTGKTDIRGKTHPILGIVEHASRANLALTALRDKAAITILEQLIPVIKRYGKPSFIRTDNEPVFDSKLLQLAFRLLGIRHQKTELGCPWMNGRIERFFGTLKGKLNPWEIDSLEQLNRALVPFRFWYNHVRPHQHVDGRTPAEVWQGVDCFTRLPKHSDWFEAWDGLLTGYYAQSYYE